MEVPVPLEPDMRVLSAVRVSEIALSDKDGCLMRAVCVMGTIPADEEVPRMSVATGADNFLDVVNKMIIFAENSGLQKEELPNLRQIVAR